MKIWLDDEREAPKGWVHVKTAKHAIEYLDRYIVTEISLDNDLGLANEEGYDVVKWLEEQIVEHGDKFNLPKVHIHTANPVARQKMMAGIQSIERLRNGDSQ